MWGTPELESNKNNALHLCSTFQFTSHFHIHYHLILTSTLWGRQGRDPFLGHKMWDPRKLWPSWSRMAGRWDCSCWNSSLQTLMHRLVSHTLWEVRSPGRNRPKSALGSPFPAPCHVLSPQCRVFLPLSATASQPFPALRSSLLRMNVQVQPGWTICSSLDPATHFCLSSIIYSV